MTHHEVMLRQLRRLGKVVFIHHKDDWTCCLCSAGYVWLAGIGETVPATIRDAYFNRLKDLADLDQAERKAA